MIDTAGFLLTEKQKIAIRQYHSDVAEDWIDGYSTRLTFLVDKWQLAIESKLDAGFPSNSIYFVRDQDQQPCVLKLGPGLEYEVAAYHHFANGHKAQLMAELSDTDLDRNALLMQRLMPGDSFRGCDNREKCQAEVLPLLTAIPLVVSKHRSSAFPDYGEWLRQAFSVLKKRQPHFLKHVQMAEQLAVPLWHNAAPHLLHGDLHHENILAVKASGKNNWIAIDPKGVIGPRLMEVGRFMHNFLEDELAEGNILECDATKLTEVLAKRILLAQDVLGIETKQLLQATYIDVVLATCWSINSEGQADAGIYRTEIVAKVLRHFG